ncbi:MAG TPA: VOC family protein [Terriglobales bacterium]|nr:VOC family protein [Terriglobales bacterium]
MTNVKPVPEGYHTVTPYLIIDGVDKVLEFLKRAFGAEVTERIADDSGAVRHAEVKIGDSVIMMGQARDQWKPRPSAFYLYLPDVDAVYQRALQAGGTSLQEPTNQFYGDRSGGVEDAAGNQWWIATHVEDVSREELQRRMASATKAT